MRITTSTESISRAKLDLLVLVHGINDPKIPGLPDIVADEWARFCRQVGGKKKKPADKAEDEEKANGAQTLVLRDGRHRHHVHFTALQFHKALPEVAPTWTTSVGGLPDGSMATDDPWAS